MPATNSAGRSHAVKCPPMVSVDCPVATLAIESRGQAHQCRSPDANVAGFESRLAASDASPESL